MTHIKRMAGAIEGELMPQTLDSIDNKEQTQSHGVSLAQAALSAIPPQFAHQPLDMVGVIFFELGYFGRALYGYSCDTSNTHLDIEKNAAISELLEPDPILPDNESATSTSKAQAKNIRLLMRH